MKKLFFLLCVFMYLPIAGQARLGISVADIKKEFPGGSMGLSNDSIPYCLTNVENGQAGYFFDSDKECVATAIYPSNVGEVIQLAEVYNKTYIIISTIKWTAYFKNGVCNVELCFRDNGLPYFFWKYAPKN